MFFASISLYLISSSSLPAAVSNSAYPYGHQVSCDTQSGSSYDILGTSIEGPPTHPHLTVSIPIHPQQYANPTIITGIRSSVAALGVGVSLEYDVAANIAYPFVLDELLGSLLHQPTDPLAAPHEEEDSIRGSTSTLLFIDSNIC